MKPNLKIGEAVIYDRRWIAVEGVECLEGTVFDVRHSTMAPDKDIWVVDIRDINGTVTSCPAEKVYILDWWHPGSITTIFRNQGQREATVVARIGLLALLEYEMPSGTTALVEINIGGGGDKTIPYNLPKHWISAIEESGVGIVGMAFNSQSKVGGRKAKERCLNIAKRLELCHEVHAAG